MGVFSIALPDRKVIFPVWDVSCSEEDRTLLFKSKWMSVGTSRNTVGHGRFDSVDLRHVFSNVTGTAFMKSVVAFLENDASMTMGPEFGARCSRSDGKRNSSGRETNW